MTSISSNHKRRDTLDLEGDQRVATDEQIRRHRPEFFDKAFYLELVQKELQSLVRPEMCPALRRSLAMEDSELFNVYTADLADRILKKLAETPFEFDVQHDSEEPEGEAVTEDHDITVAVSNIYTLLDSVAELVQEAEKLAQLSSLIRQLESEISRIQNSLTRSDEHTKRNEIEIEVLKSELKDLEEQEKEGELNRAERIQKEQLGEKLGKCRQKASSTVQKNKKKKKQMSGHQKAMDQIVNKLSVFLQQFDPENPQSLPLEPGKLGGQNFKKPTPSVNPKLRKILEEKREGKYISFNTQEAKRQTIVKWRKRLRKWAPRIALVLAVAGIAYSERDRIREAMDYAEFKVRSKIALSKMKDSSDRKWAREALYLVIESGEIKGYETILHEHMEDHRKHGQIIPPEEPLSAKKAAALRAMNLSWGQKIKLIEAKNSEELKIVFKEIGFEDIEILDSDPASKIEELEGNDRDLTMIKNRLSSHPYFIKNIDNMPDGRRLMRESVSFEQMLSIAVYSVITNDGINIENDQMDIENAQINYDPEHMAAMKDIFGENVYEDMARFVYAIDSQELFILTEIFHHPYFSKYLSDKSKLDAISPGLTLSQRLHYLFGINSSFPNLSIGKAKGDSQLKISPTPQFIDALRDIFGENILFDVTIAPNNNRKLHEKELYKRDLQGEKSPKEYVLISPQEIGKLVPLILFQIPIKSEEGEQDTSVKIVILPNLEGIQENSELFPSKNIKSKFLSHPLFAKSLTSEERKRIESATSKGELLKIFSDLQKNNHSGNLAIKIEDIFGKDMLDTIISELLKNAKMKSLKMKLINNNFFKNDLDGPTKYRIAQASKLTEILRTLLFLESYYSVRKLGDSGRVVFSLNIDFANAIKEVFGENAYICANRTVGDLEKDNEIARAGKSECSDIEMSEKNLCEGGDQIYVSLTVPDAERGSDITGTTYITSEYITSDDIRSICTQ